ncbi:universal stress protein [Desulfotalea psychrophila]|uniref:UspA domain-containing protein n=1 Tax=Desulfotalea psychrophila (strain LSv54 / DSM 12343) TaxID=177439 RepID=Q6AQA1_DESPS|nr:universal stress protein [Desulfotalea psychrophila]CAG35472.1 unknown protein [Desulfotalea psychrophila LSv54]
MIQKILVPIAFSQHSQGMLDYAAELAESLDAELLIVNIISTRDIEAVERISSYGYKVDTEHYLETIRKDRGAQIIELTEKLTLPDERVSFSFRMGDPTTELLKMIVEQEIDMIVMGVKTRDFTAMFTGSVAERLFRKCPITVVSYRDKTTAGKLHRRAEKLLDKKHI